MNFNRIWAMVIRYTYNLKHSWDKLTDMFYWPAMDMFIWGITGLYLAQYTPNTANYLGIILSGLIFWVVIWRAQYEITTNLLAELWDRNLVNLFTTPLTVLELMSAFILFGFLKTIISVAFSAILAFWLYQYNVFSFGILLLIFFVNLLLTGWACGFLVGALIIRFGQKIQTLAWAGVALIAPFSAVYYPLSVLPQWAQNIAYFIPSTYIFEAIRQSMFTGHVSYDKLLLSFGLNIIYFIISVWFFIRMFNKSRQLGLGRLI
jgi:ABC-2 type transport system permease protein